MPQKALPPEGPGAGIEIHGLRKHFGPQQFPVIKGIDLTIPRGQFVAITGRSGSGKSTLLYLASGLDDPSDGRVNIEGRDIHRMEEKELHRFRNLEMGFVFQFHYLLPELNSLENILMPARKARRYQERLPMARDLLDRFEVSHCAGKQPAQMSGGEQQRVALARALIMEPRYLFADEPTGNLDSVNGETVMKIFRQINRDLGTTVVMVTHELDYAQMASRQIVLVDGEIDLDEYY